MKPKLSKYLAGFRPKHTTQQAFLKMIETWRAMLNKVCEVGVMIMDLSNIFDRLNHNFFLCKLKAFGFNEILTFIQGCFTNRHQQTKIGDKLSKWQKISAGVSQSSILGNLFFNIFINDLFLFTKTTALCNYADDNIMYSLDKNSNTVISRLRYDFAIISQWV